MEFDNNIPIYLQVIHKIKLDIIKGKLIPGGKMLSSRELSQELGINFNTVARVYKEMEMEDIVYTKRGLGTFITESTDKVENIRIEMARDLLNNFITGMDELGFSCVDMIRLINESK